MINILSAVDEQWRYAVEWQREKVCILFNICTANEIQDLLKVAWSNDESRNEKRYGRPMKYSVLMSVYVNNSPDYLRAALESIYEKQIRKPDEIVVVFDGPLNEQLDEVLTAFAADKKEVVRYLPHEMNRGLGEALRIGAEQCTGDYILRMDADDISAPDRFEKQIAYVEAHPEIDVLGTGIAEFQQSADKKMRLRVCPEAHEDIVKMGKRRNPMNHVSVCIKRTSLEKCGGYWPLPLLEDYYLWLRMIAAGCRFANIHEPLVCVRVGNDFEARRGAKERITGWKVLQEFMLKHGMITRKEALMNMLCIRVFVNSPAGLKKIIYSVLLRK